MFELLDVGAADEHALWMLSDGEGSSAAVADAFVRNFNILCGVRKVSYANR